LSGEGPRWISLATGSVTAVYCDLSTDGGGWTLAFLRNSASLGDQGSFGAGEEGLSSLAIEPAAASASSAPQLGWIDINLQPWSELQLVGYAGGAEAWRSASIPRAHLRLSFGEPGYLLYGGDSPYHWCGGDRSYTDYGLGAVDNPPEAPANCKYHGGLGSGWDFGGPAANTGLTLCGYDGSQLMTTSYGGGWVSYGSAGGAQAIWLR
jgi:hypothetical protein